MFALKEKNRFIFICVAKAEDEFQKKINAAFSNWRGMQQQGSNKQIAEFLEKYDKVIVTVESYNVELTGRAAPADK